MDLKIKIPDLTKLINDDDHINLNYINVLSYYPKKCQSLLKSKKNTKCKNQTNPHLKYFCKKHNINTNNEKGFIYLLNFPNEIIEKIYFNIIDPIDKIRLSITCKKLRLIYNKMPLYYKINCNVRDK